MGFVVGYRVENVSGGGADDEAVLTPWRWEAPGLPWIMAATVGRCAVNQLSEGDIVYKATVRALLRYSVRRLNKGDFSLMLKMASPDFELAFPGDHSWSTMFRPQVLSRERHVTHLGIDEAVAFAERFVAEGVQFEIEDILVNGPPWRTRVAVRVHNFIPGGGGEGDVYANRAILFQEIRWGRLLRWETYEDTQRVAAWDEHMRRTKDSGGSPELDR